MTWQDTCQRTGGMVTVHPQTGTPVCRLNGQYADMRSWDESLADNEYLAEEQMWALAGKGMTEAGVIYDATKKNLNDAASAVGSGLKKVAIIGGIGLLLFLYVDKKLL